MTWNAYKETVDSSRKVILFPLLLEMTSDFKGLGIDIGCGDGEISNYLCLVNNSISMIGVDNDCNNITNGKAKYGSNVRLILADVANFGVGKIGMRYDFAISNCLFNHLSREEVENVLIDVKSCLRNDAKFIIIVPHWKRARAKYRDHIEYSDEFTAITDYGNRQHFRYGEWYQKKIEDAGMQICEHRDVLIPHDDRLSPRYSINAGEPIFSVIICRVKENSVDQEKKFEIATDNRKFEIDLLWKRSLFFWGFIAASFVGYAAAIKESRIEANIFSAFGLVCSIAWSLGNRGSKYWQNYWERKVILLQNHATGYQFKDYHPINSRWYAFFAARRYSVSKITMGISDYCTIVWFALIFCKHSMLNISSNAVVISFIASSLVFAASILIFCKSD